MKLTRSVVYELHACFAPADVVQPAGILSSAIGHGGATPISQATNVRRFSMMPSLADYLSIHISWLCVAHMLHGPVRQLSSYVIAYTGNPRYNEDTLFEFPSHPIRKFFMVATPAQGEQIIPVFYEVSLISKSVSLMGS